MTSKCPPCQPSSAGYASSGRGVLFQHRCGEYRHRFALTISLALLMGLIGWFEAQAQGQLGRSLERLAAEIVDLFPKVEGDVVKVEGNQAFITLGAPDHIREGMELAVVGADFGDE